MVKRRKKNIFCTKKNEGLIQDEKHNCYSKMTRF